MDASQVTRSLFGRPRIVFASPHCVLDPSSGAAVATLDALEVLAGAGFCCQAFCATSLDPQEEICVEELLAQQGLPYETRRVVVAGRPARMLFTRRGRVPVTLFRTAFSQTGVLPEEAEAFLEEGGGQGGLAHPFGVRCLGTAGKSGSKLPHSKRVSGRKTWG